MLAEQREKIDAIDKEIVALFEERMQVVTRIAECKKELGLPIFDESREVMVYEKVSGYLKNPDLSDKLKDVYQILMSVSKDYQKEWLIDHKE